MHSKLEDVCISFYDDVFYYIFSLSHDKELAKDVTQDTFLKALKSLHNLKEVSKVKSWLFIIARNSYLTEAKKRKKMVFSELFEELVDVQTLTPEQAYLLREKEGWWNSILATLKEEEKRLFELRVNEKYSFEEIAELFKTNAGAVRVKFHRVRIKLINMVEKRVRENE